MNVEGVDEDMYFIVVDLICSLGYAESKLLDSAKARDLIQYFLSEKGLKAPYLPLNLKDSILGMFTILSQHKRTVFTKNKDLMEPLIVLLAEFMLISDPNEMFHEDDISIGYSSMKLFQVFADNLPKKLMGPIIDKVQKELWLSKDPKKLTVMYLIYCSVCAGLADRFKNNLPFLMNEVVELGLNHPDVKVKDCALKCISYFSEFCLPDILKYNQTVIPSLSRAMDHDDIGVIEHAIFVMDVFCEYLEDEQIVEFLPTLVPKILSLIKHPKATYKVRKYAIDCLCSIMNAGESQFGPYLEQCYLILREIIFAADPEIQLNHGTTFSCVGKLLQITCKKDKSNFASKFLDINNMIYERFMKEHANYDLAEGAYTFFYEAVETLGEEYGREVFPKIWDSISQILQKEEAVRKESGESLNLDDEDNDPRPFQLSNLSEAKASAVHCLGAFAHHSPYVFEKYEKMSLEFATFLFSFEENDSPAVRQQVLSCLRGILTGMIKRTNNGILPPYVKGITGNWHNDEIIKFFSSEFLTRFEFYILNEDSKDNVSLVIQMLKDTLIDVGPQVLKIDMENIQKLLIAITQFDLTCFDKGDDDEDDLEADGNIFMALCDLLIELSNILKGDSYDLLSKVLPGLFLQIEKGETFHLDEFFAAYCDIAENCPRVIDVDTDLIADMIFESPTIKDPELCRNAAFLLGLMFELNPPVMKAHTMKALEFYQTLHMEYKEGLVLDNVVAGIVRVYCVDDQGFVPLDKVFFGFIDLVDANDPSELST